MHEKVYIYGKHALMEALRNAPEIVDRVYTSGQLDPEMTSIVHKAGIIVEKFDNQKPPKGVDKDSNHQGFIGRVIQGRLVRPYSEFISSMDIGPDSLLLVLGEVQDPQNVGAIIRTAGAFGARGVLIPEHNQAQVTGTVVKVSAGQAFTVPLVSIGNVNNTIADLKKRGFWIYGLDGEAKKNISEETFDAPTVFILGNESKGIRQKTLELCDVPLSIKMNPRCESMNVAASSAVAMYAWSLHHKI